MSRRGPARPSPFLKATAAMGLGPEITELHIVDRPPAGTAPPDASPAR